MEEEKDGHSVGSCWCPCLGYRWAQGQALPSVPSVLGLHLAPGWLGRDTGPETRVWLPPTGALTSPWPPRHHRGPDSHSSLPTASQKTLAAPLGQDILALFPGPAPWPFPFSQPWSPRSCRLSGLRGQPPPATPSCLRVHLPKPRAALVPALWPPGEAPVCLSIPTPICWVMSEPSPRGALGPRASSTCLEVCWPSATRPHSPAGLGSGMAAPSVGQAGSTSCLQEETTSPGGGRTRRTSVAGLWSRRKALSYSLGELGTETRPRPAPALEPQPVLQGLRRQVPENGSSAPTSAVPLPGWGSLRSSVSSCVSGDPNGASHTG